MIVFYTISFDNVDCSEKKMQNVYMYIYFLNFCIHIFFGNLDSNEIYIVVTFICIFLKFNS